MEGPTAWGPFALPYSAHSFTPVPVLDELAEEFVGLLRGKILEERLLLIEQPYLEFLSSGKVVFFAYLDLGCVL